MEIIAKKYPRKSAFIIVLSLCVLLIAIGAALFVAYAKVVNFPEVWFNIGFAHIVIGAILTGMMIFALVRYCRLPENLITYENGILTFPKGFQCRAEEVTEVKCNEAKPYYKNITYDFRFGSIKLMANGRKIKVYYVAGAANACERLKAVVREAKLMAVHKGN